MKVFVWVVTKCAADHDEDDEIFGIFFAKETAIGEVMVAFNGTPYIHKSGDNGEFYITEAQGLNGAKPIGPEDDRFRNHESFYFEQMEVK